MIDSSDAKTFAAELPDALNDLPKNSKGDRSLSVTA